MSTVRIEKAAVLGAGVMGAAIAAHLANAGLPTHLLDLKPDEPTEAERVRGLTGNSPAVADRLARSGIERAARSRPPAFFSNQEVDLVTPGNLEDHVARLQEVDWVIEAVVEDLEVKKRLFAHIAPHLGDHAILSTNTSGLSIAALAQTLPPSAQPRFLATHFFNPPRYLKLLEVVPTPRTDPDVLAAIRGFAENRLGKGVVIARDTPNFIANRIGVFAMMDAVHRMLEDGYSILEVDAFTGPLIGRPKSATFRTADVVGLDTLVLVADSMARRLPDGPDRDRIMPPEFVREMVRRGLLGEKSGGGFYKRAAGGNGRQILVLDPVTLEYGPSSQGPRVDLPAAAAIEDTAGRILAVATGTDRAGSLVGKSLRSTLVYAARHLTEIANDIVSVDRAMRWGFGWELGPFELWDTLGVRETTDRLLAEGLEVPDVARRVIHEGQGSFYRREGGLTRYFDVNRGAHLAVSDHPRHLSLVQHRARGHVMAGNDEASIIDLGDGVACVELHSKMNTISPRILEVLEQAVDIVESDRRGLVIGTAASNFSAGANLKLILDAIAGNEWQRLEEVVQQFQRVAQKIRFCRRPVVAAPRGLALGGGCEIILAATEACAAAETYIGLPEVGAGVIPAAGGCKEFVRRLDESIPGDVEMNLFPLFRRAFEIVGTARVASSAREGVELGYLRRADQIVMNADHLLYEARERVLELDRAGYRPPRPRRDLRVPGAPALAVFRSALYNFREAGEITAYDQVVGERLAWVLCGGDITGPARVSEKYLLDLERRAFLDLCRRAETQERMAHLLETGKPLRN